MVRFFRRRTIGWFVGLAALVVGLVLGLSACSSLSLKTEAARVSEIIDTQLGDPKTFNYALNDTSPNVFGLIYDGLLNENALTSELEPALAEAWEVSPDKKRVTFTLREGLKWSDGHPLTADDVIFTYQDIYLNPDIPTPIRDIISIGKDRKLPSVRKLNDRQVEFTTPEPFAPFVRFMGGASVLPKHVLEPTIRVKKDGKPLFLSTWGTGTNPQNIVCNGPYLLESYVVSQRVIFRRNPHYWRKDAQGNAQPYIERIVWRLVENQNTALLQFRSGGPDLIEPLRPEDFPLLKQEEKRGKFTIYEGGPRQILTFMMFNQNRGSRNGKPLVDPIKSRWFNTKEFRQAVAYAIDRDRMNANLFRGLGFLVNSPIIPQSPYYLSPEQGLKTYDYQPEKAKQILLKAGFRYNDQGQLLDAAGNRVSFTLTTNAENVLRMNMTAQIKQDLAKIGIEVNLSAINFNVLTDQIDTSMDWEAMLMGFGGGREPYEGFNMWSPEGTSHLFNQQPQSAAQPITGRLVTDWEREIGQLYIEASQEFDEAKRRSLYVKTQHITQENLPFIYLVNPRIMAAVRDRIQGVRYPEGGGALWNIQDLKIVD